jgi:secernin
MIALRHLALPQARQTYTTVGVQPLGSWGYHQGFNEHGIVIGRTPLRTRLQGERLGILGVELTRLALERSRTARQALDLLGDLICRHGTSGGSELDAHDSAFLVVDGREAFVVETAGSHWVYQEVREVRAVSDFCTVRQDWDGISRGLASLTIERGWWPGDGSKIDFAGSLAHDSGRTTPSLDSASALRRWGRTTLLLEQQNGSLDTDCICRLLSDHFDGCVDELDPLGGRDTCALSGPRPICPHGDEGMTVTSLVVDLDGVAGRSPVGWCNPGPPCLGVYLPLLLDGELPAAFDALGNEGVQGAMARLIEHVESDAGLWEAARVTARRLQTRLDQETEEVLTDTAQASPADRLRQTSLFMQHVAEQFDEMVQGLLRQRPARKVVAGAKPSTVAAGIAPFRV